MGDRSSSSTTGPSPWFAGIEEYERTVPAKILRDAKALRESGFDWNEAYIGEPYVIEIRRLETSRSRGHKLRASRPACKAALRPRAEHAHI